MHQMHSLIYESPAISSISGIFLEGQEMFISLSPATHLLISFVLHVIGISLSMFIWHLFPKNTNMQGNGYRPLRHDTNQSS
ncbi:hypothetical protein Q1695_011130 [Nippostrongylus brasiliensis]|nr:hypothetical protein Q1695_011130 [Nippostrongylus brasiliensis]